MTDAGGSADDPAPDAPQAEDDDAPAGLPNFPASMFERPSERVKLRDGRTLRQALDAHRLWMNLSGTAGQRLVLEDEDLSWALLDKADLGEARLTGVSLRNARLRGANLVCAWVERCDLFGVQLAGATLSVAQFLRCDFRSADLSQARVDETCFARCQGLHGLGRARTDGTTYTEFVLASIERRRLSYKGSGAGVLPLARAPGSRIGAPTAPLAGRLADWLVRRAELATAWDVLRSVGASALLGSSGAVVAGIIAFGRFRGWYNGHFDAAGRVRVAGVSFPFPKLPMPTELVLLLVAVGLVTAASLIFKLACPAIVQEYTEARWSRELKLNPIEYRSANYSRKAARSLVAVLYVVGGVYTIWYTLYRATGVVLQAFGP